MESASCVFRTACNMASARGSWVAATRAALPATTKATPGSHAEGGACVSNELSIFGRRRSSFVTRHDLESRNMRGALEDLRGGRKRLRGWASKANGGRGVGDCPNGATRHDDSAHAWQTLTLIGCRLRGIHTGPWEQPTGARTLTRRTASATRTDGPAPYGACIKRHNARGPRPGLLFCQLRLSRLPSGPLTLRQGSMLTVCRIRAYHQCRSQNYTRNQLVSDRRWRYLSSGSDIAPSPCTRV